MEVIVIEEIFFFQMVLVGSCKKIKTIEIKVPPGVILEVEQKENVVHISFLSLPLVVSTTERRLNELIETGKVIVSKRSQQEVDWEFFFQFWDCMWF